MDIILVVLMLLSIYALVYYRLMVRYFDESEGARTEPTLMVALSPPPWRGLNAKARRYAQRWWMAVGFMMLCFLGLVVQFQRAAGG